MGEDPRCARGPDACTRRARGLVNDVDRIGHERELAGPMSVRDVNTARNEVLKAVRGLIESGEFRPARAGEDLVS